MIREVEPADLGAFRAPMLSDRMTTLSAPERVTVAESIEQEITRLTWAVLDGSAALSDRQRLADLVRNQHDMRRRLHA